jgi:ATP-dependent Lon protease
MKKAGANNPLLLLDEIDKMSADFRGDPASALLEVLDSEQNHAFNDHYLDLDYDLSDVMFITTANTYNIPRPLLDRMEIIELSGYTEEEKHEIARLHIIPKLLEKNGLGSHEIGFSADALKEIVRHYTQESGVRALERAIDKIMRKVVKKSEESGQNDLFELRAENVGPVLKITAKNVADYLGARKIIKNRFEKKDQIGLVNGLAWTEVGGETLLVESVVMEGKGLAVTTGKLGEVMKESIETAKSYVRSRSREFGINPKIWSRTDIHIHVPEGATPKDGPSAGIAMATALISALTQISVRKDVAMTGEITLRGRVLPIGGLKEKVLAAHRMGIKTVIIPSENEKDIEKIPENIAKELQFVIVNNMDEVTANALNIGPFVGTNPYWHKMMTSVEEGKNAQM